MPLTEIEGVNIYYEDEGEGRPIMMIHGFSADLSSWDEQAPALLKGYRVVRYDCRGHGRSGCPADPAAYSQEILVREALGLMDELGLEKAYVCGLSMGGNVALHLAFNHPHRVEAVIAACTGSGSSAEDGFIERFEAIAGVLDEGKLELFADLLLSAPSFSTFTRLRPDLVQSQREQLMRNDPGGLANTIRGVQMKRPSIMSLEEKLKRLEAPVLILVGEEDMPCSGPAKFMNQHIPRSRLVVFPETGHILNLERPADFNREVMDFLSDVESGQI
jgi:pimeloyl-ACP methyl ester carboxylesterase